MKRLKVLLGSLFLVAGMIGFSAFTSKDYHKAVDFKCFQFDIGEVPSPTTVVDSQNYTSGASFTCPPVRQRYCAICFDADLYPEYLNDGSLDFENSDLNDAVTGAFASPSNEGSVINGITFHYRSNPM